MLLNVVNPRNRNTRDIHPRFGKHNELEAVKSSSQGDSITDRNSGLSYKQKSRDLRILHKDIKAFIYISTYAIQ